MEGSFDVSIGGNPVGRVTVRRMGLYYQFSCRCRLSGDIPYRLKGTCGRNPFDLGILVPQEGWFILNTKVPVKRIGEGDMYFSLVSRQAEPRRTFVPISPEEPFSYLSRLKESFLVRQNGVPGILI